MTVPGSNVGVLAKRFLSESVGLLEPNAPLTLCSDVPVKKALATLRDHKIGCIIAVDSEEKIVGIFTERDVVLKLFDGETDVENTALAAFMTREPKTVGMTAPIGFALNLMSTGGYRHLPIVDDDNCPIGIISVKDIIDHISKTVLDAISSAG